MMPQAPMKNEWPKYAVGPLGNRARFDCAGDVPVGWTLEGQSEPLHKPTDAPDPVKRGPGRPPKAPNE